MSSAVPVIAIDGPSGSGKGTIARRVAGALGWHLLDSGSLYRLVALGGQREGLAPDDEAGHARLAATLDAEFGVGPKGEERIQLGGEDVANVIRTESCGEAASRVAIMSAVRAALVGRQRAFAVPPGLVADGRDMGTVIFPAAPLKIFLTASPDERARRRHKQLMEKGIDVNLRALSLEIAERDRRDANRTIAPLRPADDAVILDSTAMTIDEVVDRVLELAAERLPANRN
jgi:cytidylate kinase